MSRSHRGTAPRVVATCGAPPPPAFIGAMDGHGHVERCADAPSRVWWFFEGVLPPLLFLPVSLHLAHTPRMSHAAHGPWRVGGESHVRQKDDTEPHLEAGVTCY